MSSDRNGSTNNWLGNQIRGLRARSSSPNPEGRPTSSQSHTRSRSSSPLPLHPGSAIPLGRMPSSDALDRSIHNAIANSDGSDQSKDEIIAKLKKANRALTDKTAEMESTFMNQCNILASEISEQGEIIKKKDAQIEAVNARLNQMEEDAKGKDGASSALEKENSFQKQTITDLKNQLFQLQNDVEDAEFDKSEENAAHKKQIADMKEVVTSLENERSALALKVDEKEKENDQIKAKLTALEEAAAPMEMSVTIPQAQDSTPKRFRSLSPGGDSVKSEMFQNWKQLDDAHEKLKSTENLLLETQSALSASQKEHKAALKRTQEVENKLRFEQNRSKKEIAVLKKKLESKENDAEASEGTLVKLKAAEEKLAACEKKQEESLQEIIELKAQNSKEKESQVAELKSALRAKDITIVDLHERLESYNDDLTKAEEEIDKLNSQIDSEDVVLLKKDLETARQLLKQEKETTATLTQQYEGLSQSVEKLQDVTEDMRDGSIAKRITKKDEQIASLKQELDVYRASMEDEKESSKMMMDLKSKRILELEKELKDATKNIDSNERQDASIVDQLQGKIEMLKNENESFETKLYAEQASNKSQVAELEARIDSLLRKISMIEEAYKLEIAKLSAEIVTYKEAARDEAEKEAEQAEKEKDYTKLLSEIAELKSSHEEEMNEMRQDIETREETWDQERNELNGKIIILENELSLLADSKQKLEASKREIALAQTSDSDEVSKLREELQKFKDDKQSTTKRAYLLSMEKKYKKELSDLEIKRKREVSALQDKISDRDTTIAATIKSSVVQENEIILLQEQINKLRDVSSSTRALNGNLEVEQLQRKVNDLLATKSAMAQEIQKLKQLLSDANEDRARSPHTPPANVMTRQLNDYKRKLQERDNAIATLVKSSITQEQQITALREEIAETRNQVRGEPSKFNSNGPSWQEFTRVQDESEMFAGQIIELDEEIEDLKQRLIDEKLKGRQGADLSFALEELSHQVQEQKNKRNEEGKRHEVIVDELKKKLREEEEFIGDLQADIKSLKAKVKKNSKLSRVQDELEEVEGENHKLQQEVRDLRRRMRTAQLEAEKVPDLESEIAALRNSMSKMKIDSVNHHANEVMELKAQTDLQNALAERDAIETELTKAQDEIAKYEGIIVRCEQKEVELRDRVEELKSQIENSEKSLNEKIECERNLNARLTDAKDAAELKSRQVVEKFRREIKDLEHDIDEQNEIIAALTNEVKKLRSTSVADSDANDVIVALTDEVKKLRNKQMSDEGGEADVIQALSDEVKRLHTALKRKDYSGEARDIEATVRSEVQEELNSMRKQKEFLAKEVSRLHSELDSSQKGDSRIGDLKKQVEQAEKGRTQFEKTMISTYERKLNLMQMNKDLTIDGLRKELSKRKERQKETEGDLLSKIRSLESEKNDIEAELQAKMQHKNAKIQFLEQTLSAHEQVSGHMKDELDQLQNGMETVSVSKRAEVEELQEELMSVQSKATNYERDITSLKMKIEELRLQHRNEVVRLENTISSLESDTQTPMMRDVALERERRLQRDHQQQLKDVMNRVSLLQEENMTLKQKKEKDGKLRPSNNDKWRNSQLQEENLRLKQRLKEYEGDNDSVRSSSSRRSSRTDSSRIPRSPAGSYRRGDANANYGRDDISTHTEKTF